MSTSFSNTPQAGDDWFAVGEDAIVNFDVMANDLGGKAKVLWSIDDTNADSDGDGTMDLMTKDAVAAASSESSDLGARIWIENGVVKYDSNPIDWLGAGETALDRFTYAIRLANGTLSWATVYVTITGSNDAPVVSGAVLASADEDDPSPAIVNLLANASDADRTDDLDVDSVGYTVTGGTWGSAVAYSVDAETGALTLDPAQFNALSASESIELTFTYNVVDGNGGVTAATAVVTITGSNDAPVVANAIADQRVNEDTFWSFTVPVNAFSDVDGDALSYHGTLGDGSPLPSWLTFNAATRTFSGTPPQDFNGPVSLTVTASDSSLGASDTFNCIVDPVNDAPDASPVVLTAIAEDSSARLITQADLLGGASDVEGDTLTITGLSIASGSGTLLANGDGTWTYTPAADDDTSVTFNYTVSDGLLTDTSTATMDITPVDDFIYTSPAVFTGTGDPNDFDGLGNPTSQTIEGTNGADTIYGGAGNDIISGGNNTDTIYGGSGGDTLDGGNQGDALYGGSGNDTILGSTQNDRLIGGYGADSLTGGTGADTFGYLSQQESGDTITDFSESDGDKIEFASMFGFDSSDFSGSLSAAGAVDAGKFGYMYDAGTNMTTIYVDTDGVFGADMEIKLSGNIALTSSDFVFGGA